MEDKDKDRIQREGRKPGPLKRGLLLAALAAVLAVPAALHFSHPHSTASATDGAKRAPSSRHVLGELGSEPASADVRRMANWVADSHDNGTKSFVILDKTGAKIFLFAPDAKLQAAAPALLGAAHGDDTVPGIGDKPLKDIQFEERTTPAGRFVAEVGESSSRREDVVWVDYVAAVSMHRIIKLPERLQALATPQVDDNRMSYGCINLPDAFYEKALRPAADKTGVIVYILPETRPLEQTFASFYDVTAPTKVAQH